MASKKTALSVEHVSMKFNLSSQKVDNIKEYVIKMLKKELMYQEFWALKDVNFEIKRGDRVGIMGLNGAGKSTLLKVIAGVLKPETERRQMPCPVPFFQVNFQIQHSIRSS